MLHFAAQNPPSLGCPLMRSPWYFRNSTRRSACCRKRSKEQPSSRHCPPSDTTSYRRRRVCVRVCLWDHAVEGDRQDGAAAVRDRAKRLLDRLKIKCPSSWQAECEGKLPSPMVWSTAIP